MRHNQRRNWLTARFGLTAPDVDAGILSYARIHIRPDLAAWLIERSGLTYNAEWHS